MRKLLWATFGVALISTAFAEDNNENVAVVDLGLESGILWTTCNLGATNPWNCGNYYAWGETETKKEYSWNTYKYCDDWYIKNHIAYSNSFTKYCYDSNFGKDGFTDTLTILEPTDDVATVVLGSDYSMPTAADWKELTEQCRWEWTSNYNGHNVNGYIIYKAKSDKDKGSKSYYDEYYTPPVPYTLSDTHIFLPAAGGCWGAICDSVSGPNCNYWAATHGNRSPDYANYCHFFRHLLMPVDVEFRYKGYPIRAVRRK